MVKALPLGVKRHMKARLCRPSSGVRRASVHVPLWLSSFLSPALVLALGLSSCTSALLTGFFTWHSIPPKLHLAHLIYPWPPFIHLFSIIAGKRSLSCSVLRSSLNDSFSCLDDLASSSSSSISPKMWSSPFYFSPNPLIIMLLFPTISVPGIGFLFFIASVIVLFFLSL